MTQCTAGYLVSDYTLDRNDGLRVICSRQVDEKSEHRGAHIPPPDEIAKGATPWENCSVRTDQYDWGNYCPVDPEGVGVHRCMLPADHHEVKVDVPTGLPDNSATTTLTPPCACRCGMKRESGRPKRDAG